MASKYQQFDRTRLSICPLSRRRHLVDLDFVLEVGQAPIPFDDPALPAVADAMAGAIRHGSSVILLMGAHVIKQGLSRYVCDLVRRKWVSVVATNGACAIHDFELARVGATSESVAQNIRDGRFGMWQETAELNDVINAGCKQHLGYGEAVGKCVGRAYMPDDWLTWRSRQNVGQGTCPTYWLGAVRGSSASSSRRRFSQRNT